MQSIVRKPKSIREILIARNAQDPTRYPIPVDILDATDFLVPSDPQLQRMILTPEERQELSTACHEQNNPTRNPANNNTGREAMTNYFGQLMILQQQANRRSIEKRLAREASGNRIMFVPTADLPRYAKSLPIWLLGTDT